MEEALEKHEEVAPLAPPKSPGFTYLVIRGVLRPIVLALYRPRIVGRENVPKDGPVILASNHLSFIDSIAIPLAAPRRVQFLAKSHYFEGTGFSGWVSRTFFHAIGAVGVKRGAGANAQAALDQSKLIVESGAAFALYPEGTRSLDGRLYRGRTGVSWLALSTGATIVPVGLIGTDEIQPVGAKRPRIRKASVIFGEPIDVTGYGPATSGKARRQVTDEVMTAIGSLTGQERAGVYNETPPDGALARIADRVRPRERM